MRKLLAGIVLGALATIYLLRFCMTKNTSFLFWSMISVVALFSRLFLFEVMKKSQIKKTWESNKTIGEGVKSVQNLYENEIE